MFFYFFLLADKVKRDWRKRKMSFWKFLSGMTFYYVM